MFGLFKTEDTQHPALGTLRWHRGAWRGEVSFPADRKTPLIIGGTRRGPDPQAVQHAVRMLADYASIQDQLKHALYEHYEPYAEAVREGHLRLREGEFTEVTGPEHALRLAEPEAVAIVNLDGKLATEICYRVPWDEEHILGARFRGQQWVELCGSTLVP